MNCFVGWALFLNYFILFYFKFWLWDGQVQNANHLKQGCLILIYLPYCSDQPPKWIPPLDTPARFLHISSTAGQSPHPSWETADLTTIWHLWVALLHGHNENLLMLPASLTWHGGLSHWPGQCRAGLTPGGPKNQLISVFLLSSFLGICCLFIMTPDCREHIKVEFFSLIRDQKHYHSDHRIAVFIFSSQTYSWNMSHHLKSSSKVGKITFSLSRQTFF